MKCLILLHMACPDDKSASKDTLEDDNAKLTYSVTRMRKLFPKKCSQYLSKKLKMEHYILETTDIKLNSPKHFVETEDSVHEMVTDDSCLPMEGLDLSEFADLGKEMENILCVLEQIKSEKDCDIIKTCSQGSPI